jgi:hypothetical protein
MILMDDAIDATPSSIARVVHSVLGERYMFHRRRWFMFDGLKWCYSPCGPRDELSTTVVDVFEGRRNEFNCGLIDKVVERLKHAAFKDAVTSCCQTLFAFRGPLDVHAEDFLCFTDGIIDVKTGAFLDAGDPSWRMTIWFECPRADALGKLADFAAAAAARREMDVRGSRVVREHHKSPS